MIKNEFATPLQPAKVWVGGVQNFGELVVGECDVAIEIEGAEIPGRIREHHLREKILLKKPGNARPRTCAGEEGLPTAGSYLAPGRGPRKHLLPGAGISGA